jgi:hypothetical protein
LGAPDRLGHQDAKVPLVRKEGMSDERDGGRDRPHLQRDQKGMVGRLDGHIPVDWRARKIRVLREEYPHEQQAERARDGGRPEQQPLERLGARIRQKPEVEEGAEEVSGQDGGGPIAHGQAPRMVSKISRASGA